MAQKKQRKPSIVSRLRARLKRATSKLKTRNTKNMAWYRRGGNRSRFRMRNPFRSFRNPFRSRRSFSRPRFRRGGGGGFSRRMPIIGMRVPSIFIWLAVIGGGLFFFKDAIKPLANKLKNLK